MTEKRLCMFHKEDTPSLVIYDKEYHCYGCGAHGPLSDIGVEVGPKTARYVEDLDQKMTYITGLPCNLIRGINAFFDTKGYYIVWPNLDYYKLRLWGEDKDKYRCPSGIQKPLFWAGVVSVIKPLILFIVEGEINALSLVKAYPDADVCSPGSATDFCNKNYLNEYKGYDKIVIIADNDGPGAIAAITLKSELTRDVKDIQIVLLHEDCNELLTTYGKESLRQSIENLVL